MDKFLSIPIFFNMTKQFSIKKISNNIYKIEEPWFKEHANLYLFSDKKSCLLIDAGLGLFNVKDFLESKGFKNIKVVLTHAHFDHFGGIKYFLSKDIFIPPKIYKNLKNKKLWGLDFLKVEDFSPDINFIKVEKIFKSFFVPPAMEINDNIKVGKFNLKIIEAPGHSDDSVVYYDNKNEILVTGDTLYNGKAYFDLPNSGKVDFIKSLKKIISLDFDLVLPGHNEVFNKVKALKIIEDWTKELMG